MGNILEVYGLFFKIFLDVRNLITIFYEADFLRIARAIVFNLFQKGFEIAIFEGKLCVRERVRHRDHSLFCEISRFPQIYLIGKKYAA